MIERILSDKQIKWLDHLSDTDQVKIMPFDPTAEEKFQGVKKRIRTEVGEQYVAEHHGATSLGISGQDEIDVYVPVASEPFDSAVEHFQAVFGKPRSLYPKRRARFVTEEGGKHVDIFVINRHTPDWQNLLKFEGYLKVHPQKLEEYRILKEQGNGLSTRAYYRRKLEFLNSIITLAKSDLNDSL